MADRPQYTSYWHLTVPRQRSTGVLPDFHFPVLTVLVYKVKQKLLHDLVRQRQGLAVQPRNSSYPFPAFFSIRCVARLGCLRFQWLF
jgi:hypothetical protein